MTPATKSQADDLIRYLEQKFRFLVVPESVVSTALMSLIHIDLTKVLAAKGVTIGPLVYLKDGLTFDEQMEVITHEAQHVADWWRDPIEFYWAYVTDADSRVKAEVRSYHAQLELTYARTKVLPSLDTLAMPLESGYLLSDKDIALGRSLLEQAATSVISGVRSTEAGRAAIEFLEDRHPELLTA